MTVLEEVLRDRLHEARGDRETDAFVRDFLRSEGLSTIFSVTVSESTGPGRAVRLKRRVGAAPGLAQTARSLIMLLGQRGDGTTKVRREACWAITYQSTTRGLLDCSKNCFCFLVGYAHLYHIPTDPV